MHPTIIYIQNSKGEITNRKDPISTQLNFTPQLDMIIYSDGIKSKVVKVTIDVTPNLPAIIIYSQLI